MRRPVRIAAFAATLAASTLANAEGLEPEAVEFFGYFEVEGTVFFDEAAYPRQNRHSLSAAVEPTLLFEWANGDVALTMTPFLRFDEADSRRSHVDVREFKLDLRKGDWDATIGADIVYWGKTEAVHLVDIINQTDAVEGLDLEAKLGQPMVRVGRLTDYGAFDLFYLPWVRERSAVGFGGRLRGAAPATTKPVWETDAEEWTPSVAGRWTHVIEDADLGLSIFHGVSRDPAFQLDLTGPAPRLAPVYSRITQLGFDGQYTSDATLWKGEAIWRTGQRDRNFQRQSYVAATGGLEHTLFGVYDEADLGLIAEYAYDGRGDAALTPFQDDLILGARLALNDEDDTSLLATAAIDRETGGTVFRLEAERRIIGSWKLQLEGQAFAGIDNADLLSGIENDPFVRLKLRYFW